jgi:predicted ATP-grasp superfamily ATP-dependent carboligase
MPELEISGQSNHPRAQALPPAILLDGDANALSVARSLSRTGVAVFYVGPDSAYARHSRFCQHISLPPAPTVEDSIAQVLLGARARSLAGAVLLPCSDAALNMLARERPRLTERFRLDQCDSSARLAMLDKLSTYQLAQAAGVATPRFWIASDREHLLELKKQLVFPLIVKPRLSHLFEQVFGCKHIVADSFDQLMSAFDSTGAAGLEVMLVECIPGGDDTLCSYYTYLDEHDAPLFHFTKRVIRRLPAGMGAACYAITDWIPELIEPALALFRKAGLRGLANVEFKRDPRDGQYKLIECNARFTAANCLVASSGFDLGVFSYNRILGRTQPPLLNFQRGLRLWDPLRDVLALRELRQKKQITVGRWLRSVMHRQTFPFFSWSDPMPALVRLARPLSRLWPRRPAEAALKSSTLFADMPTNSHAPVTDQSAMPIVGK